MSRRLAMLALVMYPLGFRRRYGAEMLALLDESPVGAATVLDLLRGAVVAHVRPPAAAGCVGSADRVRASASGVLACWVAFAAAGFAFYNTTEDAPFTTAGHAHPLLGDVHISIQVLAVVASGALILGALPLILTALGRARSDSGLRRHVYASGLAVGVFIALTAALVVLSHGNHSRHPATAGGIGFIAWGLAGLACAAVCVVAARRALFALPVPRWRLITAFEGAALVSRAMAAMTVATALYAVALPIDAARLASSGNGPLQALTVSASLIVQVVVMAIAAALALATTRRGRDAAGALRAGA
jgi:hypothetical protein